MDLHTATVRLAGGLRMQLPKENLTAAEIVVLKHLHGQDGVVDVSRTRETKRQHRVEVERLRSTYGDKAVEACFPGASSMTRLPKTLAEAGLIAREEQNEELFDDEDDVDAAPTAPADVVAKLTAKAKALT